jgi:hypothetical protein
MNAELLLEIGLGVALVLVPIAALFCAFGLSDN